MAENTPKKVTEAEKIGLTDGQFVVERTDGSREWGWEVDSVLEKPDPDNPSKLMSLAVIVQPLPGVDPGEFPAKMIEIKKLLSWQPQGPENLDDDTVPLAGFHAQAVKEGAPGRALELPHLPEEDGPTEVEAGVEDARKIYQNPKLAKALMRQEIPPDSDELRAFLEVLTSDARTVLPYKDAQEQLTDTGREVRVILERLDPSVGECVRRVSDSYEQVKHLKDTLQDAKRVFESDLFNTPRDRAADLINGIERALSEARSNPGLDREVAVIGSTPVRISNLDEATKNIARTAYVLENDPSGLRGINALVLDETQQQLLLEEAVGLEKDKTERMHTEVAEAESRAFAAKHVSADVAEEALRLASGIRKLPEGATVGHSLEQIDMLVQQVSQNGFDSRSLGNFVAELGSVLARLEELEGGLEVVGHQARSTEELVKRLQECSKQLDNAKILTP